MYIYFIEISITKISFDIFNLPHKSVDNFIYKLVFDSQREVKLQDVSNHNREISIFAKKKEVSFLLQLKGHKYFTTIYLWDTTKRSSILQFRFISSRGIHTLDFLEKLQMLSIITITRYRVCNGIIWI